MKTIKAASKATTKATTSGYFEYEQEKRQANKASKLLRQQKKGRKGLWCSE